MYLGTLSNVSDETFPENSERILAVTIFSKKSVLMFDRIITRFWKHIPSCYKVAEHCAQTVNKRPQQGQFHLFRISVVNSDTTH